MKLYNYDLIFFDFEIFENEGMATFKKYHEDEYITITDKIALSTFLHLNRTAIFIGYNNKNYDNLAIYLILNHENPAILNNFDPKIQTEIKQKIYELPFIFYDTMPISSLSLKQFELNIGEAIFEINFSNPPDNKTIIEYNKYDVKMTEKLFDILEENEILKNRINIIKYFNRPINGVRLTTASIVGLSLNDNVTPKKQPETHKYKIPNFIKELIPTNQHYFLNIIENYNFQQTKTTFKETLSINDFEMIIGEGGIHGCNKQPIFKTTPDYVIIDIDATSFYPSIMCGNDNPELRYHSSAINNHFKLGNILQKRLTTTDKNENQTLKLVLNTIYGIMGEPFNKLYDGTKRLDVCITGQLILLGVIYRLKETLNNGQPIQINTDGLTIYLNTNELSTFENVIQTIKDITKIKGKIEKHTNFATYMPNVNNFIGIEDKKIYKEKGIYKIEQGRNCKFPIVPIIVKQFLITGKTPSNLFDEYGTQENLGMFSNVQHIQSNNYETICFGTKKLNIRNARIFVIKPQTNNQIITKYKKGILQKFTDEDKESHHHFGEIGNNHLIGNDNIQKLNIKTIDINKNGYLSKIQKELKKLF